MGGTFTEAREKVTWEKDDGSDPKGQWLWPWRLTSGPNAEALWYKDSTRVITINKNRGCGWGGG